MPISALSCRQSLTFLECVRRSWCLFPPITQAGDPVSFKVEPSEKGTVATEVTVQVSAEEAKT